MEANKYVETTVRNRATDTCNEDGTLWLVKNMGLDTRFGWTPSASSVKIYIWTSSESEYNEVSMEHANFQFICNQPKYCGQINTRHLYCLSIEI